MGVLEGVWASFYGEVDDFLGELVDIKARWDFSWCLGV